LPNNQPVVLVHGMFGFGPQELGRIRYWGSALDVPSSLRRFETSVGPVSSPHDRACELAAQIKGVRVDYGEVHANANGHERFGRDYRGQGLWPNWDGTNPLHMVGHSLGASTIRALQSLLAVDFWNWGSSERWISSISSLAGPLNGSTAIYYFGADLKSGLIPRGAGITPLLRIFELYTADNSHFLDAIYDLDLDHWGYRRREDEDLIAYLNRVRQSQFFWGPDNALYSVSLQSAYRDNERWPTFADTYYISYVAGQTVRFRPGGYYYPGLFMHSVLKPSAWYMGRFEAGKASMLPGSFKSSDWWENDGLVPTYSQIYPHSSGQHDVGKVITAGVAGSELLPGRWYTQWERGLDHVSIAGTPRYWQKERQKRLYSDLYRRLAALDLA
jgi:triacylglycerol esterase/lipase EstA (alpha/beta hydrolase family)